MRRPNTDSTPNNPVTFTVFDTLRGHKSRPHCHDTVLRYAVTLQVFTYLYLHIVLSGDLLRIFLA